MRSFLKSQHSKFEVDFILFYINHRRSGFKIKAKARNRLKQPDAKQVKIFNESKSSIFI